MKTLFLLSPLMALLFTGCVASNFTEAVQAAGTANKHIKAEFSGWNAHMVYESWPAGGTNSDSVVITPKTTLQLQQTR